MSGNGTTGIESASAEVSSVGQVADLSRASSSSLCSSQRRRAPIVRDMRPCQVGEGEAALRAKRRQQQ